METKNSSEKKGIPTGEIIGIVTASLSIFLSVALIDNTWEHHYGSSQKITENWMGPAGLHAANFMLDIFGYASCLVIFLMIIVSIKLFRRETSLNGIIPAFIGWNFVLFSITTLLTLTIKNSVLPSGGIAGLLISGFLIKWTGEAGTLLTSITMLLTGLVIATPFSVSSAFAGVKTFLSRKSNKTSGIHEEKPKPFEDKVSVSTDSYKQATLKDTKNSSTDTEDEGRENEPLISEPLRRADKKKLIAKDENTEDESKEGFEITPIKGEFKLPPLSFLKEPPEDEIETDKEVYISNARALEQKLLDFGVAGKVMEICPGPVVTMYEFAPAPGIKINKVASLANDLAMALKTHSVRIVAPIPGKSVIGIELANAKRQMVYLKEILESDIFQKNKGALPMALGQDIVGHPVATDLAKMPHLLIAGATGTGKSVGLNAMICSMLYRYGPDMLRILMVDPKRIELSLYDGIPHLIHPVVSEPKEATRALRWAVLEMERRYQMLEEAQARNLASYNKNAEEPLPLLVIIIDELADLMMVSSKEVESAIARLAQMARAAGIHLMIATQRPSVDVLTGLIKANFPARLSFKVSSKVDSRTILDTMGAENLLGMGDMLFLPPGSSFLNRIHGAYVAEDEIVKIVNFLKAQGEPDYDPAVIEPVPGEESQESLDSDGELVDEKYDEAIEIVTNSGQASISGLQRRLRVGYNRAARMIEQMERDGIVTPTDGMGRRQVIVRGYEEDKELM